MSVKYTAEYDDISCHYGDRVAQRSGVPLMKHIDEGLVILDILGAEINTKQAWCIHPLFQDDESLSVNLKNVKRYSSVAVLLTMEYRARANDWLSDKVYTTTPTMDPDFMPAIAIVGKPSSGVLPEVKQMLIADKVQNYKDFCLYHKGTHDRSDELEVYFATWLDTLGVTVTQYKELVEYIS